VLHRGTWHWGPFPDGGPEVRLFNVQGLRYAEDNRSVEPELEGLSVEVDLNMTWTAGWPAEPRVELDDARRGEVVPATVAELVDSITAREAGPDADGRPTFTTTSRSGGCTAACLEAWWGRRR